jgi:hypothetical protein
MLLLKKVLLKLLLLLLLRKLQVSCLLSSLLHCNHLLNTGSAGLDQL